MLRVSADHALLGHVLSLFIHGRLVPDKGHWRRRICINMGAGRTNRGDTEAEANRPMFLFLELLQVAALMMALFMFRIACSAPCCWRTVLDSTGFCSATFFTTFFTAGGCEAGCCFFCTPAPLLRPGLPVALGSSVSGVCRVCTLIARGVRVTVGGAGR